MKILVVYVFLLIASLDQSLAAFFSSASSGINTPLSNSGDSDENPEVDPLKPLDQCFVVDFRIDTEENIVSCASFTLNILRLPEMARIDPK
jgi:hypothetical protein